MRANASFAAGMPCVWRKPQVRENMSTVRSLAGFTAFAGIAEFYLPKLFLAERLSFSLLPNISMPQAR